MSQPPRFVHLLCLWAGSALAWDLCRRLLSRPDLSFPLALALLGLKALVLLVPAAVYARRALGEGPADAFALRGPLRSGVARALLASAIYLAAIVGLSALLGQLSLPRPSPSAVVLTDLNAAVEEAAYRGFLLLHLARSRRFGRANLIQAGLFVLVHLPVFAAGGVGPELVPMVAVLFLFALVLGYVAKTTRSIWIAAALHAVNNLLAG